jgi:hypothetical protein
MPGSPLTNTGPPGTIPPPSTRLNSSIAIGMRSSPSVFTSLKRTGVARGCPPLERLFWLERCSITSTKVFHSPQSGQRPIHFN